MHHTIKSWIAVGLLSLTGCTTCDAPYDYCGPMQTGSCGGGCDFLHRENSVLSGTTISEGEPTLVEGTIHESAQLKPVPHQHPAAMIGRRPHTNQIR